jgi:hypothetical protein
MCVLFKRFDSSEKMKLEEPKIMEGKAELGVPSKL